MKNYHDEVRFLVNLHVNCINELKNPMLVGYNLTENFTADVAKGIFRNVQNKIHSCFSWGIYQSITIKSNQFAGKKIQAVWLFEETKRVSPCLTHCSQKKITNKHSQVLLVFSKEILENETTGVFSCWRPAPHLL